MMRIAKLIASSGICSRREAEKRVKEARVEVDGEIISSPALNVTKDNIIKVDGKIIEQTPEAKLWIYYKPNGLITTHKDLIATFNFILWFFQVAR